jgi:ribosomal protein L37AE/L43A
MNQKELKEIASKPICPQCGWAIVHRTKRQGIWEHFIMYPLGYRAYRCELCDFRFRSRIKLPIASLEE